MIMMILIGLFLFFNLVFIIAINKKDFSIIDIAWGLSFLIIYLIAMLNYNHELTIRIFVLLALVGLWSLRLSGYIFYRSLKKGKEDARYSAWRDEWGKDANKKAYIRVYMLQLVLAFFIASPLISIFYYSEIKPFGTVLDFIGLILWTIGFLFEVIGDYQKNKFKSKKENHDQFCKIGLWQYSRHPNYFGEALLWWGIFFIVMNHTPIYLSLWGPLLLNFLLLKVSGVAMLEESYAKREGFEAYKKQTNRFIPWFKKGSSL